MKSKGLLYCVFGVIGVAMVGIGLWLLFSY